MSRILITGGPRTGKTTLAAQLSKQKEISTILATDGLIGFKDFHLQTLLVASWLDQPAPWIIEGCQAAHALQHWLSHHPDPASTPCDVLYWLQQPFTSLNPKQQKFKDQIDRLLSPSATILQLRGVTVTTKAV